MANQWTSLNLRLLCHVFCRKKKLIGFCLIWLLAAICLHGKHPAATQFGCLVLPPASFNLSFAYLNGGHSNLLFEVCGVLRFCTSSIPNATDRENRYTPCTSIFRSILFSSHRLISTTSAHTQQFLKNNHQFFHLWGTYEFDQSFEETSSLWNNGPKVIGFCQPYLFVSFLPKICFKSWWIINILLHRQKLHPFIRIWDTGQVSSLPLE